MARGIQIPFTLDVRQWRKGIKRVELDIEDLGDEFKDLERDADRAMDDIEDSFKDVGRAAQRAGDDMQDGIGQGLTSDSGNLKTAAGSLAGEVVDEFVENWGEAVRSGDYASAFRETLSQLGQIGGAIGGPAGAVAGGAIALGLTTVFDKVLKTELKASIASMFDTAASDAIAKGEETGQGFAQAFYGAIDSEQQARSDLTEFFGADTFNDALDEAGRLAAELGVEFDVVGDAITGNVVEQERARQVLEDQRSVIAEQLQQQLDKNAFDSVGNRLNQTTIDKLNGQLGKYDAILGDVSLIQTESRRTGDNLSTWEGYVRTTAEQARRARDFINTTRPPDMAESAWNLERMAAAAESTKYTLDQLRSGDIVVDVRVAGATGQGGQVAE